MWQTVARVRDSCASWVWNGDRPFVTSQLLNTPADPGFWLHPVGYREARRFRSGPVLTWA
jgi:hypothetical protein